MVAFVQAITTIIIIVIGGMLGQGRLLVTATTSSNSNSTNNTQMDQRQRRRLKRVAGEVPACVYVDSCSTFLSQCSIIYDPLLCCCV